MPRSDHPSNLPDDGLLRCGEIMRSTGPELLAARMTVANHFWPTCRLCGQAGAIMWWMPQAGFLCAGMSWPACNRRRHVTGNVSVDPKWVPGHHHPN